MAALRVGGVALITPADLRALMNANQALQEQLALPRFQGLMNLSKAK